MLFICFFCAVGICYLFRDVFLYFVYRRSKLGFWIFIDKALLEGGWEELIRYCFDMGFSYNPSFLGFITSDEAFYLEAEKRFLDFGVKLRLIK